ncbi:hypothetical protein D9M71_156350 [compost metagenome]
MVTEKDEKDEKDEKKQRLYEIYRDYIKHEDSLIHSRTSSLITIQSFVLATFGFCYQERYKMALKFAQSKTPINLGPIAIEYGGFLLALGLVGLATSYIALRSIRSAHTAIKNIEAQWNKIDSKNPATYLPGITGGGKSSATRDGGRFSIYTPMFFIFFWATTEALLFLVFDIFDIFDANTLSATYLDIRAWLEKLYLKLPIPW